VKKRVLLYFGSFNPVHLGHTALAEWAVEHDLGDEIVLVVSPQNPFKPQRELAPEMQRFEMAELACGASRYPGRIKVSAVEFLLPRPSYTIDTLNYLEQQCGGDMDFALLMGTDILSRFSSWKAYRTILERYPIFVYPRRGHAADAHLDRIHLLADAPLCDFASTEVRETLERGDDAARMLAGPVLEYIRRNGLWTPEQRIRRLDAQIERTPDDPALYVERGLYRYRRSEWGPALNDFNRALRIDPSHTEAKQYADLVESILAFRYKDIYNP